MRLAILASGGDSPGLNAVVRAVVRTATTHYRSEVLAVGEGFSGLLRPPELWPLSPHDVQGLVRRGGSILGRGRGDPFHDEGHDRSAEVVETVRWLGLDALICVGGQRSLSIAARLAALGVPLVCVPKTIENDVPQSDATFGYATAVEIATDAIDKLQTAVETGYRVMYLEVAGERAGWIALSAGLAGGADVILIPELAVHAEEVAEVVRTRERRGKPATVVVVAEGARLVGGPPVVPGAAATAIAARVAEFAPAEPRVTVLGHLQRGGDPNPTDRQLATLLGAAAVRAAHEGAFGTVVGVQGTQPRLIPLGEVLDVVRGIDPRGELLWTAAATGISFGGPLPGGV